ncbi:uncharacterized protein LOC118757294 [Rhagoletis pomonella]|uniref:uncharacterized protein LOC118757294 n=1 Tax=Rhagoletis pomonella TaxID=28610 RepID=UPI001784EF98|nr:uncharacterized protein LOC118757294 [Rhagoletis pomonella]
MNIRALIDTGATLTYINGYLRKQLEQRNIQPHPNKRNVQLADQTCVASTHSYPVQIKYNGQATNTLVAVIPNLAEKMILGMDFLAKRGIVVSLDNQQLAPAPPPRLDTTHALCSLIERAHLNEEQNKTLADFFGNSQRAILQNHRAQHRRRTRDHTPASSPTKQRYYPRNPAMQQVINAEVDELLAGERIEPSKSAYSSPIFLVRKKQGSWRMCIDYRQRTRRIPVTSDWSNLGSVEGGKIYLYDRPQKWVAAATTNPAREITPKPRVTETSSEADPATTNDGTTNSDTFDPFKKQRLKRPRNNKERWRFQWKGHRKLATQIDANHAIARSKGRTKVMEYIH